LRVGQKKISSANGGRSLQIIQTQHAIGINFHQQKTPAALHNRGSFHLAQTLMAWAFEYY